MSKMTTTKVKLLGTKPDHILAYEWGMARSTVFLNRVKAGIKPFKAYRWTDETIALLGTMSDVDLSNKLDIDIQQVFYKRNKLKIAAYLKIYKWADETIAMLGTMNDTKLAAILNVKVHIVKWKRLDLGIAPYTLAAHSWTHSQLLMLGKQSDADIAQQLGFKSRTTVINKRKELNIPPFKIRRGTDKWEARTESFKNYKQNY